MNSTPHALALAACTAALTAVVAAQGQGIDYAKIEILTEQVAPNLYLLSGSAGADPGHQDAAGGRIGVLAGPDGIFMVDTQYAPLTDQGRGGDQENQLPAHSFSAADDCPGQDRAGRPGRESDGSL